MDRALIDFAEATKGLNSEMRWTLSEDITRRQMAPVFERCASGAITPDQALDVCMDCVNTKVRNTMQIFDRLFNTLFYKMTHEFGAYKFPALLELEEFFMGLNDEAMWSTSESIAREELKPTFERCSKGELSAHQCLDLYIDNILAKRDFTLGLLQGMVVRLAQQIKSSSYAEVANHDEGEPA